jgi:membrane-bound lytic murein transglycosylase B
MPARAYRALGVYLAAFVLSAASAFAAEPATPEQEAKFHAFLSDFRAEAMKAGISSETYDLATGTIDINPRVQELNEKQPEFVRPVWEYLSSAVSDARVKRGMDSIAANGDLLMRLQATYGVSEEVLAAVWGMETNFGQNIGTFNLFEALATLAYDGPRTNYARRQFIAALKIAQEGGFDPATMTSSWAGAFGHTQFVPTTYLEHAIDGDGDGKRDLWNSPADALASTANYLKESGWRMDEIWGEEVKLPDELADPEQRKTLDDWASYGVTKISGEPISGSDTGFLFLPAGYRGPAFLVTANFNAVLKYNFATSYALAIGLLSDRLKGDAPLMANWPYEELPLDARQNTALQEGLTALGFDTGGSDGVFGRRSRAALRDYQKARGIPADGFATAAILTRILNERAALQR